MKNFIFTLFVMGLSVVLSGCANTHVVKTISGNSYESMNAPVLEKGTGYYSFVDKKGNRVRVKQDQVESIAQTSAV